MRKNLRTGWVFSIESANEFALLTEQRIRKMTRFLKGLTENTLKWFLWCPIRILFLFLPFKFVNWTGIVLGNIYYLFPTQKRKEVQNNLSLTLLQDKKHVRNITKKWFINKFITRLDFFKFPKMKESDIEKFLSSIKGLSHIDRALEKGRGAILVTGHFGSNQLIPVVLSLKGYPINQLGFRTTPLNGSRMDKKIYEIRLRYEQESFRSIHTGKFLREIFLLLSENRVLVITGDGRQGAKNNFVPLHFLGRRAFFPTGLVLLGSKTGAPLLPTLAVREGNWKNKIIIEEPIQLNYTADKKLDTLNSCAKFVQFYEPYVRRYPYLWHFWDRFSGENPSGF